MEKDAERVYLTRNVEKGRRKKEQRRQAKEQKKALLAEISGMNGRALGRFMQHHLGRQAMQSESVAEGTRRRLRTLREEARVDRMYRCYELDAEEPEQEDGQLLALEENSIPWSRRTPRKARLPRYAEEFEEAPLSDVESEWEQLEWFQDLEH